MEASGTEQLLFYDDFLLVMEYFFGQKLNMGFLLGNGWCARLRLDAKLFSYSWNGVSEDLEEYLLEPFNYF